MILCLNYTDTPWFPALPMLHGADGTLPSCPRYKICEWKTMLQKQKLPLMSHRDSTREILTEPTSTEWKPSLHETRVYCLDSADSVQCSHSDAVTATRREGEWETREDRKEGREGWMEGREGGLSHLSLGSIQRLFSSPPLLPFYGEVGGTNYCAMFFLGILKSCYCRAANSIAVRRLKCLR